MRIHPLAAFHLLLGSALFAAGCEASPLPMTVDEGSLTGSGAAGTDASCAVGFPQYPSLSPDGAIVVYSWAGDLWAAASEETRHSPTVPGAAPPEPARSSSATSLRPGSAT